MPGIIAWLRCQDRFVMGILISVLFGLTIGLFAFSKEKMAGFDQAAQPEGSRRTQENEGLVLLAANRPKVIGASPSPTRPRVTRHPASREVTKPVPEPVVVLAERLLNSDFTVGDQMALADLVFLGTVLDVDYAEAKTTAGGRGPVHTFVTFEVEQIVKGRAESSPLTLRFFGGREEDGRVLLRTSVPLFDAGERFVLFVFRNGAIPSPLAGWERGCLRVIGERVYDYWGSEVRVAGLDRLVKGRKHLFPEVVEHRPGGYGKVLRTLRNRPEERDEFPGPGRSARAGSRAIDLDRFVEWLNALETETRSVPGAGNRDLVRSAQITTPVLYDLPRPIGPPRIPPSRTPSRVASSK